MTRAPSLVLVAATLALEGACGNRPLDASAHAGSAGSAGATATGVAGGTGSAGTEPSTGAAGASEMMGAAGTASTGSAGSGPTSLPISTDEALSRIASVLWQSAPDASVLAVGARIQTTADLASVIQGMLADQRAAVGVGAFYRQWLDLEDVATLIKDPTVFPTFTPQLRTDMANETETFGVNVTLALNGTYQMLLTAPFSFINARLASIYGVAGITGDILQQTALRPTERAGLLTQPALQALTSLATMNDPPRRGTYIQERFLCTSIPFPPAGVPGLETPAAGVSLRTSLEVYESSAVCGPCHKVIDPPGLAFEGFDAIGGARNGDNGAFVDVSNLNILITSPPNQAQYMQAQTVIDGPIELAALIASNATAEDCMARQWLAFALGRALGDDDEPWVTEIDTKFAAAGFNLQALITAVLTSGPFLTP